MSGSRGFGAVQPDEFARHSVDYGAFLVMEGQLAASEQRDAAMDRLCPLGTDHPTNTVKFCGAPDPEFQPTKPKPPEAPEESWIDRWRRRLKAEDNVGFHAIRHQSLDDQVNAMRVAYSVVEQQELGEKRKQEFKARLAADHQRLDPILDLFSNLKG